MKLKSFIIQRSSQVRIILSFSNFRNTIKWKSSHRSSYNKKNKARKPQVLFEVIVYTHSIITTNSSFTCVSFLELMKERPLITLVYTHINHLPIPDENCFFTIQWSPCSYQTMSSAREEIPRTFPLLNNKILLHEAGTKAS